MTLGQKRAMKAAKRKQKRAEDGRSCWAQREWKRKEGEFKRARRVPSVENS